MSSVLLLRYGASHWVSTFLKYPHDVLLLNRTVYKCLVVAFGFQEEAGSLLVDLSFSLNSISVSHDSKDDGEVEQASVPIVEAASNILNLSSNVRTDSVSWILRKAAFAH